MYNIAYVSDQVATVLGLLGRTGDVAVHLERARRCWMKLDNDERLLQTMNNLGVLYYLQGDFDQAEGVLSQGLQKAASVTNPRPEVYLLHSSGDVKRDKGEKAAAATLERAVTLLKEGDAKRELAKTYFHLAETYFSLKRKRMALECLESAAKLVEELGYDHFLQLEAARAPLLVQYAAANKLADGYYARILKTIKSAATPVAGPEGAVEEPAASGLAAFGFGHLRVETNG